MDLEFLKSRAANFAYELRKNFSDDESPINHYVTEKEVVVLSTKMLYVFYCDAFIDYKQDHLSNIVLSDIDLDNSTCTILLKKRVFVLDFDSLKEMEYFIGYYKKYKDKNE